MTKYPFSTDGCSGCLSWAWRKITGHPPAWEPVCVEHDWFYRHGGTKHMRYIADKRLLNTMREHGYPYWGMTLYIVVRVFGRFYWVLNDNGTYKGV